MSRLRNVSPADVARILPACLVVLGVAAPATIWLVVKQTYPASQPYSSDVEAIFSWSALAVLVGGALLAGRLRPGVPSAGTISPAGLTAFGLALGVGILLLVVPVFLLVWHAGADFEMNWSYPFLNKRWVAALYGIAIITFVAMPVAIHRGLAADSERAVAVPPPAPSRRRWWSRLAGACVLGGVVWLLAGPPWHIERHHRPIDFHEMVHLGPLQAVRSGYLPFIGPASTQYGPGSQVLTYAFMTMTDRFDIVGYRQAGLLIHVTTVAAVAAAAWWVIDLPSALLIVLLGLAFSPLSFYTPLADGTFEGSYGWGNGFRYLGALLVVPAVGLTAIRGSRPWGVLALGATWGLFSWIAQENLSSTVAAGGLLILLLACTRTITVRNALRLAVGVLAGFVVFWVPVLGYYAYHGEAGAFVRNYFLVARAVAMGFQNTWWVEGPGAPAYNAYRFTTVVVVMAAVLSLWDVRRLRLYAPLDPGRVRMLAYVSVLAACYPIALYRSDSSHLINTLIALPFVLTLAFRDLPAWQAQTWPGRLAWRAAIVVVALSLYPVWPHLHDVYGVVIKPALVRFTSPPLPAVTAAEGVAFRRATAHLQDEPAVAPGAGPMRSFLEEASGLHDLIGYRKTYLAGLGSVYTGLVYFMADLTPANYLLDLETMRVNDSLRAETLKDLQGRIRDVACVAVRDVQAPEAQMFLAAYPAATVVERRLTGAPLFVLLAP